MPRGLRPRLPLRRHQQVAVLQPVHPARQLFLTASRSPPRACPRAASSSSSTRSGHRCRPRCSPRSTRTRSTPRATRGAKQPPRRRSSCSRRPAGSSTATGWSAPSGKQMTVEFLMNGPIYEKIALRYQQELAKIGIRLDDPLGRHLAIREPGAEPRLRHHVQRLGAVDVARQRADRVFRLRVRRPRRLAELWRRPTTRRSIARSATILLAPNRDELIAATKALDRVLLWNHYLVPGWTLRAARVARWDRFGHPDPLPEYAIGFPTDLVVGRRQGGQGGGGASDGTAAPASPAGGALQLAGAGAALRGDEALGVGGGQDRPARPLGVRRPQIPRRTSPSSTTSIPEAPKGGRMNFQPPYWYFNQNTQTFNTLNSLRAQGRRAAAHGAPASTR